MNDLQVFSNDEFGTIRSVLIDDEPWFAGKDVALALGYKNPRDAIGRHVDEEDKGVVKRDTLGEKHDTLGGNQDLTIINESGLYSLILSSKLESAKRFKRWVTFDVLPSIRKTGSFVAQNVIPRPLTPDDYLNAARILSSCRNERLPYVLPLIRKAGIELELARQPRFNDRDVDTARLLNRALTEYHVSVRELEKLTGIHTAQLYRIRNGTSRYNEARAAIIRDAIHALVPELEAETIASEE